MFLARVSLKCFTSSSRVFHWPVGLSASGACAFTLRSGTFSRIIVSLPSTCFAFSGSAGDFITPSVTIWLNMSSALVTCSATSITDQRSGADLNLSWASERPLKASRKFFSVSFRYFSPNLASYFGVAAGLSVLSAANAQQEPNRIRNRGSLLRTQPPKELERVIVTEG